jgi:hypothetical protein
MAEQSPRAESPEAKRCKHDMEDGAFEPSVAALGIAELAEDSDLLVQQRRRDNSTSMPLVRRHFSSRADKASTPRGRSSAHGSCSAARTSVRRHKR